MDILELNLRETCGTWTRFGKEWDDEVGQSTFDKYLGKVTTSKIKCAWFGKSCELIMELKDNKKSNKFNDLEFNDTDVILQSITIMYTFFNKDGNQIDYKSLNDAVRLELVISDASFKLKNRKMKLEMKNIIRKSQLYISNTIDDDNKFGSLPKDDKVNVVINRLLQKNNAISQQHIEDIDLDEAYVYNYD